VLDEHDALAVLRRAAAEEPGQPAIGYLLEGALPGVRSGLDDGEALALLGGLLRARRITVRERLGTPLVGFGAEPPRLAPRPRARGAGPAGGDGP
jgi:hypothetical protein